MGGLLQALHFCHHLAGPHAGAARPSARSELIRFAISMAVMAASPPLLPTLPPARSRAWHSSSSSSSSTTSGRGESQTRSYRVPTGACDGFTQDPLHT